VIQFTIKLNGIEIKKDLTDI